MGYLIKETFRTISRSRSEFFLSTAVQGVCLLVLALFGVLTLNVLIVLRTAVQRAQVFAFVTDEVALSPLPLQEKVANIAGVMEVRFVSKEEAFEELRADLGTDTSLLNALGENPLPASLRISLQPSYTTPEQVQALEQKLLLLPGVTEVWSGKELLSQLNRALRTVLLLDVIVLIIVAISVLFIVFQTTENSITSRAQEIEIMELVGASRATVRTPFLLEGTLQGALGGIMAFLLLFVIYRVVVSFIPPPLFPTLLLFGIIFSLGALLGLSGALLALERLPSTLRVVPVRVSKKSRVGTGIG
ncbi:MAG: permease-like cell division protein FtsX [candidate division WOR-3 bacterium]